MNRKALIPVVVVAAAATWVACVDKVYRVADLCDAQHLDCPAGTQCDLETGRCVGPQDLAGVDLLGVDGAAPGEECTTFQECGAAAPVCKEQRCAPCTPADDAICQQRSAATPHCGPDGTCVACLANADCQAPNQPVCNPSTHQCEGCKLHTDCASGICKPDGSGACASESEIAYVNNVGACQNAQHPSSPTDPYCEVAGAITTSGKSYIAVAGGGNPYQAIGVTATTQSITLTIVNTTRKEGKLATVSQVGSPALAVTAVGADVDVTVDGLDLLGSNNTTLSPGASCNGVNKSAKLTLRNSTIHNSGQVGVSSQNCTLVLDSNLIGPSNVGGGVLINTSQDYVITNNIIFNNSGIGVAFDSGSSGTFAFNTVAKNIPMATGGVGGVDCGPGGTKTIQASIFWDNQRDTTNNSQIGLNCALDSVVTGKDDSKGIKVDPVFRGATDYHLSTDATKNPAIVDQLSAPGTKNSDHDVEGDARPIGTSWDIGADEVKP